MLKTILLVKLSNKKFKINAMKALIISRLEIFSIIVQLLN